MQNLAQLAKLVRYFSLLSSTEAGSGHPTSSLSAADLMTVLFFAGHYHFDGANPQNPNNDRLLFSKGHASPLFYALYAVADLLPASELKTFRQFGSRLEGHPTLAFPFTEAATGSLGQGLSIGVGMALNAKYIDKLPYTTYVLLGDSEMAEGSQWEALQSAAHYHLDNLVAVLDVNRLGQRGETMYGHHLEHYQAMTQACGWQTVCIDGHNLEEIERAFQTAHPQKPLMIIAKTFKGRGISFLEDKEGWHGKALSPEEFKQATAELGELDVNVRGELAAPLPAYPEKNVIKAVPPPHYPADKPVATRRAYGNALTRLYPAYPDMVVLDAEVSNSTFAETFKKHFPQRFFEMYIAEQNMIGVGLGLARRGKMPFISTFAAFLTRGFDQIRMSQYSAGNLKIVGSHAGVSIGEDGASQMALEDIAMFRAIHGSTVLYPSDAYATEALVEAAAKIPGLVYIRTTRKDTPLLYGPDEHFPIGGCKVLGQSDQDQLAIITAGVTLHEALAAQANLAQEGIKVRIIDLYSVKPINSEQLQAAVKDIQTIITVEDHYPEGGLGEAVRSCLNQAVTSLAVRQLPKSGKPEELLAYECIDAAAIIATVKELLT